MKKVLSILVLTVFIFILSGCQEKNILVLQDKEFITEYGQEISLKLEDYLDLSSVSEKEQEQMTLTVNVKEEDHVTKDDGTYIKTGTYEAGITYKNKFIAFNIIVKDTVAPVLTGLDQIELASGTELNYSDYYSASDLNELEEIQYDTSNIDINNEGTYLLKISVKDIAGNEAQKEVPVTVKNVLDTQESSSEVVTGEDGSQSYVTTITDKPVAYDPPVSPDNQQQNPIVENNQQTQSTPQSNENTASNDNSTTNNTSSTPEPDRTESTCTLPAGNSGKIFDSVKEARDYAEEYAAKHIEEVGGYGLISSCGKATIQFEFY